MVADRIFRHISSDRPEFEMTAEKWNYLIMMTAGIQNVISSAVRPCSNIKMKMIDQCVDFLSKLTSKDMEFSVE